MQTIDEAKQELRANWETGIKCPCCGQLVKLYKRKIHWSMVVCLIKLYKLAISTERRDSFPNLPNFYFHVSEFGADGTYGGDFAKLAYWGLIEAKTAVDGSKSRSSGIWKITNLGYDFVRDRVKVNEVVEIFDGKFISFSGGRVGVRDCLKTYFDYQELMEGS